MPIEKRTIRIISGALLVWIVVLSLFIVGLAFCAPGCGPSMSSVRAVYVREVDRCLENERAIVARTGTTAEEDAVALADERTRCDRTLAAIRSECGRACR